MAALPHTLCTLQQLPTEPASTGWGCSCGVTGTAPDGTAAVEAQQAHRADALYLVTALTQTLRTRP